MFDYVFRLLGLTPVAKAIVQITAPIMAETTNHPNAIPIVFASASIQLKALTLERNCNPSHAKLAIKLPSRILVKSLLITINLTSYFLI